MQRKLKTTRQPRREVLSLRQQGKSSGVNIEALYRRAKALVASGKPLRGNINVSAVGVNQLTLLHIAADLGDEATARALIEGGANINARDNKGTTALIGALAAAGQDDKSPDVAQLLLDRNADTSLVAIHNDRGTQCDALLMACIGGFSEISDVIISSGATAEAIEAFIGQGFEPNELTKELMFRALDRIRARDQLAALSGAVGFCPEDLPAGRGRMGATNAIARKSSCANAFRLPPN
jgi:hypothetical protein